MARYHRDVSFAVSTGDRDIGNYRIFDEAASVALNAALANGKAEIDVEVHSRVGAKWLGGDDAVARYDEDPEASVFERIKITAHSVGRVP